MYKKSKFDLFVLFFTCNLNHTARTRFHAVVIESMTCFVQQ